MPVVVVHFIILNLDITYAYDNANDGLYSAVYFDQMLLFLFKFYVKNKGTILCIRFITLLIYIVGEQIGLLVALLYWIS